ncbi:phosphomannomutase [bacterium]|nr:phosphomannomutase [bacterium]
MTDNAAARIEPETASENGYAWPCGLEPVTLRAYDIRGEAGVTLTEQHAYAIGRAFAMLVASATGAENPRIALGRDGRLSSPGLSKAVSLGMQDAGAQVVNIGIGPTPMLYFAAFTLPVEAGLMVTGSHNPGHHNGMKMVLARQPFYGEDIQELGRTAAKGGHGKPGGWETHASVLNDYISTLRAGYDDTRARRRLRVVWDPGNGAAGEVVEKLASQLPGEHHVINAEIDGRFPNHHPDPTVEENLAQLIREVIEGGYDIGVAFDGDADRIGVVDGQGRIIWGDDLLMLLSRDLLMRHPTACIIADVKASESLFADIAKHGGRPIMWKTGHSLIKAKMKEEHALLAGEMSGHIFFADRYFGFDDGIYAAVRTLDMLARATQPLSEIAASLPQRFSTPEIRIDVQEARKTTVVDEIHARLKAEKAKVQTVDGVRVVSPEGWWLIRASNTQAAIIARAEGQDKASLESLKAVLRNHLKACNVAIPKELN